MAVARRGYAEAGNRVGVAGRPHRAAGPIRRAAPPLADGGGTCVASGWKVARAGGGVPRRHVRHAGAECGGAWRHPDIGIGWLAKRFACSVIRCRSLHGSRTWCGSGQAPVSNDRRELGIDHGAGRAPLVRRSRRSLCRGADAEALSCARHCNRRGPGPGDCHRGPPKAGSGGGDPRLLPWAASPMRPGHPVRRPEYSSDDWQLKGL
jgi:hypothetical protein